MRRSFVIAVPAMYLTVVGCRASGSYAADSALAARLPSFAPIAPLAKQRPADGTRRFTLYTQSPGDTSDEPPGTMTVEQTTLDSSGQRVVRRVITYDYGTRGIVIDTTSADATTLAPISERSYELAAYTLSRMIFETFSARAVTGQMGRADSMRVIDDTLPGPAFNSTDLELVVRSMPLHLGLQTTLPIYDPEHGGYRRAELHVDSVRSLPSARPGENPRTVWVVHVRDARLDVVYNVDTLSRELLGSEIRQLPHGARFRLVPADR